MNKNVKKLSVIAVIAMILTVGAVFVINNLTRNANIDNKTITISIFNKGNESIYEENISTDKKYLFEVLDENKDLDIKAEDSQYGKYITSIKGIEEGDGYYWSYYIDGQYAEVGVSNCEVENGKTYDFKIERINY